MPTTRLSRATCAEGLSLLDYFGVETTWEVFAMFMNDCDAERAWGMWVGAI